MAVNCRVVLRPEHGKSAEQNFKDLLGKFRRKRTESGVETLWKKYQYFESKGERRRRKKKEAQLKRLQANRQKHYEG